MNFQFQFTIALILGTNGFLIDCDFPLWMKYTLCGYMVSFLVRYLIERTKRTFCSILTHCFSTLQNCFRFCLEDFTWTHTLMVARKRIRQSPTIMTSLRRIIISLVLMTKRTSNQTYTQEMSRNNENKDFDIICSRKTSWIPSRLSKLTETGVHYTWNAKLTQSKLQTLLLTDLKTFSSSREPKTFRFLPLFSHVMLYYLQPTNCLMVVLEKVKCSHQQSKLL